MKMEQMPTGGEGEQVETPKNLHHPLEDLKFESIREQTNADIENKEKEELVELKEWLETSEPYQKYLNQKTTFDTFDNLVEQYRKKTKKLEGDEVKEFESSLIDNVEDIKNKVDAYYQSILRITRHGKRSQKINQFRGDSREQAEKTAELDQSRRYKHDSLLVSLRSINRYCLDLIPEKVGIKLNCKGLFSQNQLTDQNRSIAGEWAYSSAFGERIKDQINKIDQRLEELSSTE